MKPLGEKLKEWRETLNPKLTARALAKLIGVKPSYIAQIENEGVLPSPAVFAKMVRHLDFSINQMQQLFEQYKMAKFPDLVKIEAIFLEALKYKIGDEKIKSDKRMQNLMADIDRQFKKSISNENIR